MSRKALTPRREIRQTGFSLHHDAECSCISTTTAKPKRNVRPTETMRSNEKNRIWKILFHFFANQKNRVFNPLKHTYKSTPTTRMTSIAMSPPLDMSIAIIYPVCVWIVIRRGRRGEKMGKDGERWGTHLPTLRRLRPTKKAQSIKGNTPAEKF